MNIASVIAFARGNWRNDGADGETVHELCDEVESLQKQIKELRWRVVANAGRAPSVSPAPRWSFVNAVTAFGSGLSRRMCREAGFDPDEERGGEEETDPERDARESEELERMIRASGESICRPCGEAYRKHPVTTHRTTEGYPYLHKLCDGTIVKL